MRCGWSRGPPSKTCTKSQKTTRATGGHWVTLKYVLKKRLVGGSFASRHQNNRPPLGPPISKKKQPNPGVKKKGSLPPPPPAGVLQKAAGRSFGFRVESIVAKAPQKEVGGTVGTTSKVLKIRQDRGTWESFGGKNQRQTYCGWKSGIRSHHLETMGNQCLLVFTGE